MSTFQVPHPKSGRPIRVVVVDDSQLMLTMISGVLNRDAGIEVVACAKDTQEARRCIRETNPDVVTLDVEMPGMNGLEFLQKIMSLRPTPVIMVSTLTAAGTDVTLTALQIGAVDAVAKPNGPNAIGVFGDVLRKKVHIAARAHVVLNAPQKPARRQSVRSGTRAPGLSSGRADVIAIGASTGGVSALSHVLEPLPLNMPPIVITQHMPPEFTRRFAHRLNDNLPHDVREARNGEVLDRGSIRVAPGHAHLEVRRSDQRIMTIIAEGAPVSGHCPSVDVLFRSVAKSFGPNAIGTILTGMGRDGADGLLEMRRAGALCLGQSESTCVVYGMPKAAKTVGAVSEELALPQIPQRICTYLNASPAKRAG